MSDESALRSVRYAPDNPRLFLRHDSKTVVDYHSVSFLDSAVPPRRLLPAEDNEHRLGLSRGASEHGHLSAPTHDAKLQHSMQYARTIITEKIRR
jgi:hypothetical protein